MDDELRKTLIQIMEGQEALRHDQKESNNRLARLEKRLESLGKRLKELAKVQEKI